MGQTRHHTIDMIRMSGRIISGICICLILAVFAILAIYADGLSDDTNTLRITEVCNDNDITAHDENGDYGADYIELYNGTNRTIHLKGYGLSDSKTDLYRFTLPDVEIGPHRSIVVWGDQEEQELDSYVPDYVIKDIHGMNFSISSKGESIYLTNPNGRIINEMSVAANIPDGYSYQTALEDPDDFIVGEPTLYTVAEQFSDIKRWESDMSELDEPTFSVDGGWYEEALTVELSCTSGTIYYTLDGSEPDETSAKYDQPIVVTNRSSEPNRYACIDGISATNDYVPEEPVDKCTVIKAVAIDGTSHSDVAARSYFVGLHGKAYENAAVMSITMDPEDLFRYEDGIYVLGIMNDNYLDMYGENPTYMSNSGKDGKAWKRPAQMEFCSADRQETFRQSIYVRMHGGASRRINQKSFNLYARIPDYENEYFHYAFWGSQYNRMVLRAGGAQDAYATKIRDILIQQLVNDRDVGCQQAMPCVLFLNGEYWGLYNLQEQVGESYIAANYGFEEDEVAVLKNPARLADTDADARLYMDMVDYADSHDLSDDINYAYIEELMDVQSYIDYYCTEIYVANADAVANNYAVWRTREVIDEEYGDGRWRWLLYDMDYSTGIMAERTNVDVDSFVEGHLVSNPLEDRLFSALMENDTFKAQFVTTFLEIANHNFAYERVHEQLYEMAEEYCDAAVASQQRFRGPYQIDGYISGREYTGWYTEDDYWSDIQVIDDFFRERGDYIIDYMVRDLEIEP